MISPELLESKLAQLTASSQFCLALSGGLDSMVLLDLLTQLRQQKPHFSVRAIHIHHGINKNADFWANVCKQICDEKQVPLIIQPLFLTPTKKRSLEELARCERYRHLKQLIQPNEVLLTAHHQDDQAETLLLQLLRGAGPKGLAAMPSVAIFGHGLLVRPLLAFNRDSLQKYAHAAQLRWLDDDSNQDRRFDRNFIRHEVLPIIKKRWPAANESLARSAKHCAQAHTFIENEIETHFNHVFNKDSKSLHIQRLKHYSLSVQAYLIRYWLQFLGFPLPSTKKLTILQTDIVGCKKDAQPLLCWKEVEIRRFNDHIYAMSPLALHDPKAVIPWDFNSDLQLPANIGTITRDSLTALGLPPTLDQITVRFRQGGERCRLPGRLHSCSLKKLFHTWQIPPWLRDRIPLLYSQDKLVAIIGYTLCY